MRINRYGTDALNAELLLEHVSEPSKSKQDGLAWASEVSVGGESENSHVIETVLSTL